ncbi:MAG TPA: fumarylacetoacetate hydrolase family protein [Lacipirellulaceae bacterium]|nr:fumarylacetoacetate hydrolase family protein [Lacipirellulaceae bacterium]
MRLVTFQRPGSSAPRPGILRDQAGGGLEIVDLQEFDPAIPPTTIQLIEAWDALAPIAESARAEAPGIPWEAAALLAPVLSPQKIICVGLNYADHAAETGATVGDEPVIFNKFPTCLRGPEAPIELPPESSEVDYEAELVVVIGARARRVSRQEAWRHVGGYACGHDVSARDWQKNKPGKQWLLGKSFDSFAPLGPWIATPDEIADPHDLPIELRLNGAVMQSSSTRQLIFGVDYLVSYLSHVCTLLPGDLIYTGTPPGVGMARNPPVFLQPGDVVEVGIPGLGTLRNPVVAAPG